MAEIEHHLFVSDLHIPDQSEKALKPVYQLLREHPFTAVHIVGDLVDFETVSRFDRDPHRMRTFNDEIGIARGFLARFVNTARLVDKQTRILWYEGNHEARLGKYLSQNARPIATVQVNGEDVTGIPHLFELDKLGVEWIPHYTEKPYHGLCIEHGDIARKNAGYTAHGMFQSRGMSGISGHTHRLGIVYKRLNGHTYFWIENGCLCNLDPDSHYVKSPDWENGISIIEIDPISHQLYPQVIPIMNGRFIYNGKMYRG